jgi:hypothetical protein
MKLEQWLLNLLLVLRQTAYRQKDGVQRYKVLPVSFQYKQGLVLILMLSNLMGETLK